MKKELQVALIQAQSQSTKISENLKNVLKLAEEAVQKGAKLLVFSENFDTGYCVKSKDFAINFDSMESKTFQALLGFAKKYQIYLVGCVIEKEGENFYNTAFIMDKKGIVGKYRKIYLWEEESQRFQKGEDYPIFELKFKDFSTKVGLQIGYEIGLNEGAKILALKGAEILIYPSAFPKAAKYVWNISSRARALENNVFVLAANHCGSEINPYYQKLDFCGRSRIISPKGKVLSKAKEGDKVVLATLNFNEIQKAKKVMDYLGGIDFTAQIKHLQEYQKAQQKGKKATNATKETKEVAAKETKEVKETTKEVAKKD